MRSSCRVATETTDSKPPTRLRIRPVRYGYIRSRSHSAVLSASLLVPNLIGYAQSAEAVHETRAVQTRDIR